MVCTILAEELAKDGEPPVVSADILWSMTSVSHMPERSARSNWAAQTSSNAVKVRAARPGCLTRIVAAWEAAVNYLVPIGHEDETGFHCGEMPNRSESL